jgi:hypothetical protein
VLWRGFDQALNYLRNLRERLWLPEKRVGAAASRFVFKLSRAIRRQNDYSRLRIVLADQPDYVEAVVAVGHSEAQVLNYDFVVRRSNQFFCFFDFTGGIDFITVQGEVLTHREADRLFIIDDQQPRQGSLSQRAPISTKPHLSQFTGDSFEGSKSTLLHMGTLVQY